MRPAVVITFLTLITVGSFAIAFLARHPRPSGEDDDGDSGSGGGGGRRRPGRPPRPGGDPVWWPEFERQFAAYVRSPSAERSTMTVGGFSGFPYPDALEKRQ